MEIGPLQAYVSRWNITWDSAAYLKVLPEIEEKQKFRTTSFPFVRYYETAASSKTRNCPTGIDLNTFLVAGLLNKLCFSFQIGSKLFKRFIEWWDVLGV